MRTSQFFEADDGRLSMTRLLMFLAFWPATYVVCSDPDESTLSWFLSAFVLGYVGGKFGDILNGSKVAGNTPESSVVVSTSIDPDGNGVVSTTSSSRTVQNTAVGRGIRNKSKR